MTQPSASPFLPDSRVMFAWDSTCLGTAQECPRRYQYKIVEGWQSKSPAVAIELAFGILIHSGIEAYHKAQANGADHEAAVRQALGRTMTDPLYAQLPTEQQYQEAKEAHDEDEDDGSSLRNARVRTRYYLWRALVWYFEQYKNDPLEVLRLDNGKAAVELSFRIPTGFSLQSGDAVLLTGHLDKVVRFNDQLFVSDIKTTKGITASWRAGFDLSHQMSGYTLGGKLALTTNIGGVFVDGIALQVGGVKFARHVTQRTDSQLAEFMHSFQLLVHQFEAYALEGFWPMNTSFCWRCEFKDICRQPPELRAGYLNHYFKRSEAWNPLKSR